MNESIFKYLSSEDPLSNDALEFLLSYHEEDIYIDYKESFDKDNDKEWIELSKDIMAFANFHGGYLVYGIQDSTYNLIGLDDNSLVTLKNIDVVHQKINRYCDPEIQSLRSKEHIKDGKTILALLIPESFGKTHVVSKDAIFKYPSGEKKIILNKGTFYFRRSGGNHLCDSRDIDELISKRIKQYQKNLLSNISRVVEAPAEADVYILSQDLTSELNKKFIIEDAPDAIKVKGMSFTISPETPEQEISGWISLSKKENAAIPSPKILWKWYSQRECLNLSKKQRLAVAKFCIISDVPAFYWIRGCSADTIVEILEESCDLISSETRIDIIVGIAAFLGKSIYTKILKKVKPKYNNKISKKFLNFSSAPVSLFSQNLIESASRKKMKKTDDHDKKQENLKKLNELAEGVSASVFGKPGVLERYTAHAIDCFLYSQNDKYKTKTDEI